MAWAAGWAPRDIEVLFSLYAGPVKALIMKSCCWAANTWNETNTNFFMREIMSTHGLGSYYVLFFSSKQNSYTCNYHYFFFWTYYLSPYLVPFCISCFFVTNLAPVIFHHLFSLALISPLLGLIFQLKSRQSSSASSLQDSFFYPSSLPCVCCAWEGKLNLRPHQCACLFDLNEVKPSSIQKMIGQGGKNSCELLIYVFAQAPMTEWF